MLSEETVALEGLRKLREIAAENSKPEAFLIRVNPKVAAELIEPDSGLAELEQETHKEFHFEGGDALPIDTFEVVESGSREQIEERALPFKVGEEVLVRIEEPHMYNADDAVARVDSYIVSVSGGGRVRRRAQAGADRGGRAGGRGRLAAGRRGANGATAPRREDDGDAARILRLRQAQASRSPRRPRPFARRAEPDE